MVLEYAPGIVAAAVGIPYLISHRLAEYKMERTAFDTSDPNRVEKIKNMKYVPPPFAFGTKRRWSECATHEPVKSKDFVTEIGNSRTCTIFDFYGMTYAPDRYITWFLQTLVEKGIVDIEKRKGLRGIYDSFNGRMNDFAWGVPYVMKEEMVFNEKITDIRVERNELVFDTEPWLIEVTATT